MHRGSEYWVVRRHSALLMFFLFFVIGLSLGLALGIMMVRVIT